MAHKKSNKAIDNVNSRLALIMKSGKSCVGYNSVMKSIRRGKAKIVVVPRNCPPVRKSEVEYCSMLADVPIHYYNGNNSELGAACGKYFNIGVLTITDMGDADCL